MQRELRRLAASSNKEQQAGCGYHRIPDVELSAARQRKDLCVLQRAEIPGDGEHAQDEPCITHAVDDECLVGGGRGRMAQEVEADQQVRAQAHAFPADEHHRVVVGQHQRQHGKHEQVEIAEEAVIAAFVPHVADRVNVDQHAHAGHKQQPDGRKRIEYETGIDAELSQVYNTFSNGLPGLDALYPVYCHTARHAHANASTTMPTQMPLTADFFSLRPKKNMQAAPIAGNSGINQMWSRKYMY